MLFISVSKPPAPGHKQWRWRCTKQRRWRCARGRPHPQSGQSHSNTRLWQKWSQWSQAHQDGQGRRSSYCSLLPDAPAARLDAAVACSRATTRTGATLGASARDVLEMCLMEENRLSSGGISEPVKDSLQEHIAYLQQQLEKTRRHIKEHIDRNPDLKNQSQLLESIPGIGAATAALLLAELGDITQFGDARQVAAFAGLVPRIRESGTSLRGRSRLSKLSKVGSSRLRKSLYFPAITALRFNPLIKAFGLRLSPKVKARCSSLVPP